MERVGRRSLTFWGLFILTVNLLLAAGLGVNPVLGSGAVKASVAFFLIFNYFYNASVGATAYTIVAEVATARLRTKTITIGLALQ